MEWPTSEGVFISESILESIFTLTFVASFLGREGGRKMHWITRRVHLPLIMKRTRLTSACNVGDQGSIPGSGRSSGKEMAAHSSILAWKIPWTEEPGGPQSMGTSQTRQMQLSTCYVPGTPVLNPWYSAWCTMGTRHISCS